MMTTNNDWLTPETAIGARLPCGAVVKKAEKPDSDGDIPVWFDCIPKDGQHKTGPYLFRPNGAHYAGELPNLIPPTPQPTTIFMANKALDVTNPATRAAIVAAVVSVSDAVAHESAEQIGHRIADKLGCSPDAPTLAPWEAAYEAWIEPWRLADDVASRDAWKAAVEWQFGIVMEHVAGLSGGVTLAQILRTRIMGDDAMKENDDG
jgi:hypothetical protein